MHTSCEHVCTHRETRAGQRDTHVRRTWTRARTHARAHAHVTCVRALLLILRGCRRHAPADPTRANANVTACPGVVCVRARACVRRACVVLCSRGHYVIAVRSERGAGAGEGDLARVIVSRVAGIVNCQRHAQRGPARAHRAVRSAHRDRRHPHVRAGPSRQQSRRR